MNFVFSLLLSLILTPSRFIKNQFISFPHEDSFVIIQNDSLYTTRDCITFSASYLGTEFQHYNFNSFYVDGKTYLLSKGGGVLYVYENNTLERIDKSFEHRNKFHSYDFSYNKQIFSFGGYGLFDDNNLLTYFDDKTQEWHEFLYHRSGDEIPSKRKIPIGQVYDDVLFIGGGISKNVDSELNISNNRLTDFWKLDLISREWEKLGDAKKTFLEINSFNETLTKIISFKGGSLIVNQDQVFWVDILNNSIWQFTHPSKEIIFGANTIIYNSNSDTFLVSTLNHNSGYEKVMTVKSIDLLGDKTIKTDLYKPTLNSSYYFLFGIPFIFVLFVLFRKKQTPLQKLLNNINSLERKLSKNDFLILKTIIDSQPNAVSFPFLLSVYAPALSYESKVKKLRFTLDNIILQTQTLTNKKIIHVRKNKDDKRIKEVYLKS